MEGGEWAFILILSTYSNTNFMNQPSGHNSGFGRQEDPSPYRPTEDEKTLAILCHVLGIFFWIFPSLIIYLWKKDESPYIAEHAREALNFQITITLIGIIMFVTIIGILFLWVLGPLDVVLCILAALKASENKIYRYPLTWRLVK